MEQVNKKKVLFVCLGNICRSPAAEGVFLHYLEKQGTLDQFYVDSAGTSGFHRGERADSRMRESAKRRGIELPSLSRQFIASDFEKFDYIIAMDPSNQKNCLKLASNDEQKNKVVEMISFVKNSTRLEIPDPYYGGPEGFEEVLDMLEDGMKNLYQFIVND